MSCKCSLAPLNKGRTATALTAIIVTTRVENHDDTDIELTEFGNLGDAAEEEIDLREPSGLFDVMTKAYSDLTKCKPKIKNFLKPHLVAAYARDDGRETEAMDADHKKRFEKELRKAMLNSDLEKNRGSSIKWTHAIGNALASSVVGFMVGMLFYFGDQQPQSYKADNFDTFSLDTFITSTAAPTMTVRPNMNKVSQILPCEFLESVNLDTMLSLPLKVTSDPPPNDFEKFVQLARKLASRHKTGPNMTCETHWSPFDASLFRRLRWNGPDVDYMRCKKWTDDCSKFMDICDIYRTEYDSAFQENKVNRVITESRIVYDALLCPYWKLDRNKTREIQLDDLWRVECHLPSAPTSPHMVMAMKANGLCYLGHYHFVSKDVVERGFALFPPGSSWDPKLVDCRLFNVICDDGTVQPEICDKLSTNNDVLS